MALPRSVANLDAGSKRLLLKRATARIRHRNWAYDPVAFIHDCIAWPEGQGPAPYQEETLSRLYEHGRAAERGPHGLGKSSTAAWSVLHFALTRDDLEDWKIATTASAWLQLKRYLWPEIHKWHRVLRWDVLRREPFKDGTEILDMALQLATGQAFAAAPNRPESIEGLHADCLLYVFDEAKTIADEIWDSAEGAFAGAGEAGREAYALAISTPGPPRGAFYEIHAKQRGTEEWWTRHVTLEEAIAAGRIPRKWAENRAKDWGEKSSIYINRVLGDFAPEDEDAAIPIAWIEQSNLRWQELRHEELGPVDGIGCDPADTGKDMTAIAPKRGSFIDEIRYFPGGGRTEEGEPDYGAEIMATAGRLIRMLEGGKARTIIDVGGGWGASIVGRLREQMPNERNRIVAFNGMVPTKWTDSTRELHFANVRAAAYWNLRERLNPESDEPIALPPDDLLTGDLTEPKWLGMTSSGKMRLETKDDVKERLGRSPDAGDAVVMAVWLDQHRSVIPNTADQIARARF